MCGVIGLSFLKNHSDLGRLAGKLLCMLEYRGYDSTGAIIQKLDRTTDLRKGVGAPSKLIPSLGIDKMAGNVFCGQVRWATFGIVNQENAQPHEVRCKTHLFGAHNGNITNCHSLKKWLQSEGHDVKSDNDGEMLVHTIEHFFALNLEYHDSKDVKIRKKALQDAIVTASAKITGSFAAIVVDPVTQEMAAIKAGSSLYIGKGVDPKHGPFIIASSDLASVLKLTRILIPIKEKEFLLFKADDFALHSITSGERVKVEPFRSFLNTEETELHPPYQYFMEQEIYHQVKASQTLISLFMGGNQASQILSKNYLESKKLFSSIKSNIRELMNITDNEQLITKGEKFLKSPSIKELLKLIKSLGIQAEIDLLNSSFATFFKELLDRFGKDNEDIPRVITAIDALYQLEDIDNINEQTQKFVDLILTTKKKGHSIFVLACGTSFHAAKTATLFFNEVAKVQLIPMLPGEFRAQSMKSLNDGDLIIGISQSGETKDLIDIFNFVIASKKKIRRAMILNNVNSTLAQEKSEFYIPLYCGPEIAVPATKSFLNQLLLLYLLAIRVLEKSLKGSRSKSAKADLAYHLANLQKIPELINSTLKTSQQETDRIAEKLYLQPSLHILATRILGIAKEGALKIREVVLNHTEGFEGSEFKHGPNTILGVNTVFGLDSISTILDTFSTTFFNMLQKSSEEQKPAIDGHSLARIFKAISDYAFKDVEPVLLSPEELELFKKVMKGQNFFNSLYKNYPLIFIACPIDQDIKLTISQINTHKIRGADVYVIAEDNEHLREAASVPPGTDDPYHHGYITLPRTDDPIMSIFSITIILQLLALKMSCKKMEFLDRLEIYDHGVHPDSPKNVSKSITVD